MACEIIVKIKDDHKSMSSKRTTYNEIMADVTDPTIDEFVAQCTKNFNGDPMTSKVKVTIKLID